MQRFITLATLSLLIQGSAFAGDGKKEVLTLSKGKYVEVFDQDSVEQVGNIVYNINTHKIVSFKNDNETTAAAIMKPEVISRWLSIDPLAEKYPSISPYAFCGNNPILFIDPNGAELVLSGEKADVNAAIARMQNAVGGSYTVSQNKGGSVIMTANSDFKGDISSQQKAAINAFLPITSLETDVTKIGIVNNSDQVDVGNFATQKIDIGDIAQYDNVDNISGSPTATSGNGKIIHEMTEQYNKQVGGQNAMDAHNGAIDAENAYNGSTREHSVMINGVLVEPNSTNYPSSPTTRTREEGVKSSNGKNVRIQETYQITGPGKRGFGPKENLTGVTQMQ